MSAVYGESLATGKVKPAPQTHKHTDTVQHLHCTLVSLQQGSSPHPPNSLIRPQWLCSFNNSTNCVSRQKPLITFRAPANGEIAVGFRLFFPRPTVRMRDMAAGTAGAAAVGHFPSLVGCLLIIDSGCH